MEFSNVTPDVFLLRITQQIKLGLIGAQNRAVRPDPVQPYAGVLKEIGEVVFAAPEGAFCFTFSVFSF